MPFFHMLCFHLWICLFLGSLFRSSFRLTAPIVLIYICPPTPPTFLRFLVSVFFHEFMVVTFYEKPC